MTWYICQKNVNFDEGDAEYGLAEFFPVLRLHGRISFKDATRMIDDLANSFGIEMYFSDGSNNVWHSEDSD